MTDIFCVATTAAFFMLAILYTKACEGLGYKETGH